VGNIKHCPIGYAPQLTKIASKEEDIDVLFYGNLNKRRINILNPLAAEGINLVVQGHLWGAQRDEMIARSKIILNLHYYESKLFEIVRCFYLLANRRFVLSESGQDTEMEAPFTEGIAFSSYENIVDQVKYFLDNPRERMKVAKKGFLALSQRPQSDFLKTVLE
jgi:hypothetical protein